MSAGELVMPRLSDSMEEGVVVRWLKTPGEEIAVGDELVEIETDKATMVYEADLAGTLIELLVAEGDSCPVGAPIARLGTDGSPAVAKPAGASPLARRMAASNGIDLGALAGSGPRGRVMKADVRAAIGAGGAGAVDSSSDAAPTPAPPSAAPPAEALSAKGETTVVELSRLQRTVATRMAESMATVPHFHLRTVVDMTACVRAREDLKRLAGPDAVVPSLNDMVVKAVALSLRAHPRANGAYRDGRFELYGKVNVGIAVAAEDALVVPTIRDADRLSLAEIAAEARRLAARVREGSITPPELAGGTFTVSNLGMYGITGFDPVINQPQAGILGVGAVVDRAVLADGALATAKEMELTLACDHRILYGADGARFLARIRATLEQPLALAL
jgi:pyruvate dehydrogenase E2 component (dihydrolipoamide acetyltransferase)